MLGRETPALRAMSIYERTHFPESSLLLESRASAQSSALPEFVLCYAMPAESVHCGVIISVVKDQGKGLVRVTTLLLIANRERFPLAFWNVLLLAQTVLRDSFFLFPLSEDS